MHSPFPWKVVKSKHGIDGSEHVVAYLPNGNDDMTLLIVSKKAGNPLDDAALILRSVQAFAMLDAAISRSGTTGGGK